LRVFYLFGPRVRALINTLRKQSSRRTAAIWTLVVLATLVGVGALCVRLFTKVDQVDAASPLIGAVDALTRFFSDRAPTVGEMLNRTVLMMFTFSLMAMLLLSNVITALSTFFASEELDLIFSSPLNYRSVFFSKFAETMLQSSWMVFLLLVPFLGALGWVYNAPLRFWLLFWMPVIPFFAICTAAGIATTIFLARAFPVGKTRNLLRFMSVMGAGVLLLMFRIMRPELLVTPERFRDLLQMLQTPWNPHLEKVPSGWMAREVLWLLHFPQAAEWWDHALLWGGGAAAVLFVYLIARRFHLETWQAHQEAEGAPDEDPASGGRIPGEGPVDRALSFMPLDTRAIVAKDVRVFYRSPVLWTQVMLMIVIMIIYVYNIYLLPLKSIRGMAPIFTEWLAFFNIGFVAFVLVALALRFGFPAVSMEGLGFYLIHSSPLGIQRYVRVKFWSNFTPLLLVSCVLVCVSDYILGVRLLMFLVSLVDIVLFTLVISSFALAYGAVYHDFRRQSVSEIPSSFGGMVFMVSTLITICVVLAIQAVPFWFLTINALSVSRTHPFYIAMTLGCGALSIAICLGVTWAGLRWATRCLEYLEVE
jgi:ABC-2 type transport system permease protein